MEQFFFTYRGTEIQIRWNNNLTVNGINYGYMWNSKLTPEDKYQNTSTIRAKLQTNWDKFSTH